MVILCYYFMGKEIRSQSGSLRHLESYDWWVAGPGFTTRDWFSSSLRRPHHAWAPDRTTWGFTSASWTWRQLHNINIHPSTHLPICDIYWTCTMPSGKALKWWAGISEVSKWRALAEKQGTGDAISSHPLTLKAFEVKMIHTPPIMIVICFLKHHLKDYFVPLPDWSWTKFKPSSA